MKDLVEIIPDHADKVGNLNVKVLAARDAESAGHSHYMAKMLAASEAQRDENKKLAEIRLKRRGIDPNAQQPSTMAIMARPKEQDLEHFLRPLPKAVVEQSAKLAAAIEKGDEKAIAALVAEREVSREEVSHIESVRRRPKNSQGQSEKSGSGEEAREAATSAYLFTPGVKAEDLSPEEKQRVAKAPVIQAPEPEPEQPKSLASRVLHWLWKRGVPVNIATRKKMTVEEADKT